MIGKIEQLTCEPSRLREILDEAEILRDTQNKLLLHIGDMMHDLRQIQMLANRAKKDRCEQIVDICNKYV